MRKIKAWSKIKYLLMIGLLIVVGVFAAPGAAPAAEIPPMPTLYYGSVKNASGQAIQSGEARAYIGGVLKGKVDFTGGIYGQEMPPHYHSLSINGLNSDLNQPVTFKVVVGTNEYTAVTSPATVNFVGGGSEYSKRVDLTINVAVNSLQGKVWLESVKAGDPAPGTPAPYHSGTTVTLKQGGNTDGSVTTANDGAYQFNNLPAGNYKLIFERQGWSKVISGDIALTQSKTMPDLTLLVGDMNQDTFINVSDLLWMAQYIGKNPNTSPEARLADVNRDGYVNVGDLLRVAVNIGKKPQI